MHLLTTAVQNYAWGKVGSSSKAATLCNPGELTIDPSLPYAELWMGTHPNGPSKLKNGELLATIINPSTITADLYSKYKDLPFLFKVLSIDKALSIQAHPDKKLAQKLHKERPELYKDPNHKPEMVKILLTKACAVTDFEAFVGFRPLEEIVSNLKTYPEFAAVVGDSKVKLETAVQNNQSTTEKKAALKTLFKALQTADTQLVESSISKLVTRLTGQKQSVLDELLVRLNQQYPGDVGVFCALLLNYVFLKPGEAIFLAANVPHAYLSGDCVECMAASDNVVRSGLTPKYKDVETLVEMLTYDFGSAQDQILFGESYGDTQFTKEYNPPIDEFSILFTKLSQGNTEKLKGINGPSIVIATEGSGEATSKGTKTKIVAGNVFFVEAGAELELSTDSNLVLYRAYCA